MQFAAKHSNDNYTKKWYLSIACYEKSNKFS